MSAMVPIFAVERCSRAEGWAAFSVDLVGGIGPQASPVFANAHEAEAWARAHGHLAEPFLEAA